MVRDLLLIVSWTGYVDPCTVFADISSYIFKESIKSLKFCFFFYLGFLLRTFTNHRTAEEGGGHLLNSSLPLTPASQALRH